MDTHSLPVAHGAALTITLHSQTDFQETIDSLRGLVKTHHDRQQILDTVHLNLTNCFRMAVLVGETGISMMEEIGRLTQLKTVIIRGPFRAPFPLSALSSMMSAAKGLVRCSLNQMTLVGSPAEFEAFGQAVLPRHMTSLQVFDIDMIYVVRHPGSPVAEGPVLNSLMKTLAGCPKLNVLMLGGCDPHSLQGAVTWGALEPLFRHHTIHRLSLVNLPISFYQLCGIAKLMETNRCLKHLCISCGSVPGYGISPEETAAEFYKTALMGEEILPAQQKEGKAFLASMFKLNKSLQKLILFIPDLDQDEDLCVGIFQALEESGSLKALYLGSLDSMSNRSKEALMQMVQRNFVIEEFGFVSENQSSHQSYPFSTEAMTEMSTLLRLNKYANRGKLLLDNHANRKHWVDSLSNVSDDLDCIFHLLSLNPTLVDTKEGLTRTGHGKRKRKDKFTGPMTEKRTRLYRAAKYRSFSYR